jgi:hypothetical protein
MTATIDVKILLRKTGNLVYVREVGDNFHPIPQKYVAVVFRAAKKERKKTTGSTTCETNWEKVLRGSDFSTFSYYANNMVE